MISFIDRPSTSTGQTCKHCERTVQEEVAQKRLHSTSKPSTTLDSMMSTDSESDYLLVPDTLVDPPYASSQSQNQTFPSAFGPLRVVSPIEASKAFFPFSGPREDDKMEDPMMRQAWDVRQLERLSLDDGWIIEKGPLPNIRVEECAPRDLLEEESAPPVTILNLEDMGDDAICPRRTW